MAATKNAAVGEMSKSHSTFFSPSSHHVNNSVLMSMNPLHLPPMSGMTPFTPNSIFFLGHKNNSRSNNNNSNNSSSSKDPKDSILLGHSGSSTASENSSDAFHNNNKRNRDVEEEEDEMEEEEDGCDEESGDERVSGSSPASERSSSSRSKQLVVIHRNQKRPIPNELKDGKYYERRRRNNLAAKKSRDARKTREDQLVMRVAHLEKENAIFRAQVAILREEMSVLQLFLCQKINLATPAGGVGEGSTSRKSPV